MSMWPRPDRAFPHPRWPRMATRIQVSNNPQIPHKTCNFLYKSHHSHVATSSVLMAPQQLSTTSAPPGMYPSSYAPDTLLHQESGQVLGTLLLSPIKEMDSSSSNNTLIPGHPATAALAASMKEGFTPSSKWKYPRSRSF